MGHHFNGYESDFNYFYIDEEYKDDYADFEDNSIHWWYLECNKLEEKEKQSIVNRMLKNHPVDYTLFDFMRIIHPLKPTIEDTIDILKRLKEIGYVTICADFYNLFYDEESFLSSMSNLKSMYSKTVKRKSGLFNLLFQILKETVQKRLTMLKMMFMIWMINKIIDLHMMNMMKKI